MRRSPRESGKGLRRDRKVLLNGLVGGVLGGLIGGLAFDPISFAFTSADGQAEVSRGVGFTVIGLMVGFFVGVVEQWTKTAWLLMKAGPLAGKQFVLFREAPFWAVHPRRMSIFSRTRPSTQHAVIHNRGGRYEIEDRDTADGTYVNGIPVHKQILKAGDEIVLGKTVLVFAIKESG